MARSQTRRSQPNLQEAVPNHLAGATGGARRSDGGHCVCQHAVLVPSAAVPGPSGPRRSRAARAAEGRGRVCAGAGKAALPAAAAAPVPPLPRRARPVPIPGGGPSRRGAASPSPPAFPTARPPPARLQGLPPSGSRRESGSERARGRAEAARFGAAALERGARGDASPPLRVRSLARSPPPALRSFPPLPGVIDPSRAPPLPPRPF